MSTAQDILNSLHDQFGMTDSELGEALAVSREHISRLRHGKKNASDWLAGDISDLYQNLVSKTSRSAEIAPDTTGYERTETTSVPWGLIIGAGVIIVAIVIIAIIAHNAHSNNQNREEEESPQSPQITFPYGPNQFPGTQS